MTERIGLQAVLDDAQFNRGLQNYLAGVAKMEGATGQAASGISRTWGGLGGMLQGALSVFTGQALLQGAQSLGNAILNTGKEAFEAVAKFERMSLSLESLVAREIKGTGAVADMGQALALAAPKAKELLHWVEMLGIESPFSSEGVVVALRTAMAYGFTVEESQRLTKATIDLAAATGQESEVMNRVALALGQIKAKGKLAGQEILQLVNAGVDVRGILAEAFHTTTEEIMRMQEEGELLAGPVIEAIVKSFEEDFGGAAKRQATSLAGLTESLKELKSIALRELFSGAFQAAQPYIASVVALLSSDTFRSSLKEIGAVLGGTVAAGLSKLSETVPAVIGGFGELEKVISNLVQIVQTGNLPALAGMLGVAFDTGVAQATAALGRLGPQLIGWVTSSLPVWLGALSSLSIALASWVLNAIPGLLRNLATLTGTMLSAITANLPAVTAAFLQYGVRMASWALEALPGLLRNLGTFAQTMIGQLMTHLPQWVAALAIFGAQAVQWIVAQLPGLANNLGQFLNSMINWVADSLPKWTQELGKLALSLMDWVLKALPGLGENLGKVVGTLIKWAAQTIIDVTPELLELAGAFVKWIATDVLPKLPGALAEIIVALLKFLGGVVSAISPELGKVANGIIDGLASGVRGAAQRLIDAVGGVVNSAIEWAQNILGIHSPSTVMAEIGMEFIQGFIQGMDDKAKDAYERAASIVRNIVDIMTGLSTISGMTLPDTMPNLKVWADRLVRVVTETVGAINRARDKAGEGWKSAVELSEAMGKILGIVQMDFSALALAEKFPDMREWANRFVIIIDHVVNAINYAADRVRVEALGSAVLYSGAMDKILSLVNVDFSGLSLAKAFPDMAEWANRFVIIITQAVNAINWVAGQVREEALKSAVSYSESMKAIVDLINVDFSGLALAEAFPDMAEWANRFVIIISQAVNAINWVAAKVRKEGLESAVSYSEAMGKVLGLVGIDFSGLTLAKTFPDMKEWANRFVIVVIQAVNAINWSAGKVRKEALESAAVYSDSMKKVLDLVGIDFSGLAVSKKFADMKEWSNRFAIVVIDLVNAINWAARKVGEEALSSAAKFSEGMGQVLALVGSGVEAFTALADLPKFKLGEFEANANKLGYYVAKLAVVMANVAKKVGEEVAKSASEFSVRASSVLDAVKKGVEAVAAIGDLSTEYISGEKIDALGYIIYYVFEVVDWLASVVSPAMLEAAGAFAGDAEGTFDFLKKAIDFLGSLEKTTLPNESKIQAFANAVWRIADIMADAVTASAATASNAKMIAENMASADAGQWPGYAKGLGSNSGGRAYAPATIGGKLPAPTANLPPIPHLFGSDWGTHLGTPIHSGGGGGGGGSISGFSESALKALSETITLPIVAAVITAPRLALAPAGITTNYNYRLEIRSSAAKEPLIQDFQLMALMGA